MPIKLAHSLFTNRRVGEEMGRNARSLFWGAVGGLPTRQRGASNSGLGDSCRALLVGQRSCREGREEVQVATVVVGHRSRDR
jgi:hypothetical protein